MKRYGYYAVKDAKEKLRKTQKNINKMGKKLDSSNFVYKHYKNCIAGSKKLVDEFESAFKTRTLKDWRRNDKVYSALVEIMYDLYLDELPIHLWVDSDKVDKLSVGTFDFKVWERCKEAAFALEFSTCIASKKHGPANCAIRALARESKETKGKR